MTAEEALTNEEILPEPAATAEGKAPPETPQPLEVEVGPPGEPTQKVSVTPLDLAPDASEATVRVTVQPKPAEGAETPNLAPLLFVAAVAALVLLTSNRAPAGPSPQ